MARAKKQKTEQAIEQALEKAVEPAKKPAIKKAKKSAALTSADDEALVLRIQRILSVKRHIEQKSIFGGIAFLLHGNVLVGLWNGGMVARLGPKQSAGALKEPHVGLFDPTGKNPMNGWVVIEREGISNPGDLERWVALALEFVETLAIKPGCEEPLEQWVERSLRYA